jgi:hypothetical protein
LPDSTDSSQLSCQYHRIELLSTLGFFLSGLGPLFTVDEGDGRCEDRATVRTGFAVGGS